MEIEIKDLEHIREAARQFISHIGDRRVFAFYGNMGAGKTTFIKAVCEELGVNIFDCWMAEPGIRTHLGEAIRGRRDRWIIEGHVGSTWQNGQYTRTRDLQFVEPVPPLEGEIDMSNIDFTTSDADGRYVLDFPGTAERRDGTGLYVTSTSAGFETTGSDFAPSDVIKIPVTGDWTATMKFNNTIGSTFSWGGDSDLFGFYVMDNFDNGVGMRGGNNSIVNFTKKNGAVTTNNADIGAAASSNGLNTNDHVHWYRIAKTGDDYVCSYSADGETFTDLFTFTDTGVEGKMLVIDAYRQGFAFGGANTYNIEYVNFDVPEYAAEQHRGARPGQLFRLVHDPRRHARHHRRQQDHQRSRRQHAVDLL